MTSIGTLRVDLRTSGFALVRRHVDAEAIDLLGSEAHALIERFTRGGHRSEDYWSYEKPGNDIPVLYRIQNLERQGTHQIAAFATGAVLRELAETVLDAPAESTACAMIVKTPGVAGVPWHRDRTNVPLTTAINLSVFLDDATIENGCIEVVPGSHLLPDDIDVDTSRNAGRRTTLPTEAGDVLIHDVRLVHGSGDNTSTSIRRSIIIEFEKQSPPDAR